MKTRDTAAKIVDSSTIDDPARLHVSALVDGELDDATIERTIDALLASDELATFWSDAHRSGDWMRSDEVVGIGDGDRFLRKFALQLAAEPTILAPQAKRGSRTRRFWVRTGLPGASVAAALVVVAWVAIPSGRDAGDRSAAATPTVMIVQGSGTGPVAVPVAEHVLAPVDAERLSDYLAAHRDVTPFGYRGAAARPVTYSPSGSAIDSSPSR